jgi:hypothetical protein
MRLTTADPEAAARAGTSVAPGSVREPVSGPSGPERYRGGALDPGSLDPGPSAAQHGVSLKADQEGRAPAPPARGGLAAGAGAGGKGPPGDRGPGLGLVHALIRLAVTGQVVETGSKYALAADEG